MNPQLLILLVGAAFLAVFGITSILRREGISTQFIVEVSAFSLLVAGGGYLTETEVNPILFLVFVYLLTMRGRLLVDLANLVSSRGRQGNAISILQIALRIFPDPPTKLIVLVNMGIVQLRRQNPESAERFFEAVLAEEEGNLGTRYEAATHYNLGLALQQLGKLGKAASHFNKTIEVFPSSPYSKAAEAALKKRRKSGKKAAENKEEAG
jgi:tetratricopeptide (TPR) repeat protein